MGQRIVLDTNVVLSGLLWNGSPKRLLGFGRGEAVEFFTSTPLLQELVIVLSRAKFEAKIRASKLSAAELANRYAALAEPVTPNRVPRIVRDPDDDVVIGTALAAKADFIVTGDKGLLAVGSYEGVRIITVREAMQLVAQ
ncbi:MAG: putative toxin-antitoxin system toxin component, PIN family [Terracidiphilus sp.]